MTARAHHDVIVVGAGPAGAATAILFAEHGLAVLVLDRARSPRTKICGEYLSPEGARILDRLGVLKAVDAGGAVPLAGMRIIGPDGRSLDGRYRPLGIWRPYREGALAIERTILDAALTDRLRALPVDFREQVRVTDVVVESERVVGVRAVDVDGRHHDFRAPLSIGADGRASVVAQRLGCRRPHRLRRMALATYVSGLSDCRGLGEIFVDPPDYAILNPVGADRVNFSLVVPLGHVVPHSARLDVFFGARVKQLPHLARRVAGAVRVAPVVALGPLAYRVTAPRLGGVLLVGDAAGFYDPFTGEGIFSALRGAELAAEVAAPALARGDLSASALSAYERARGNAFRAKARLTRVIQTVIGRRWASDLVAALLARRPDLLDVLLGVIGDYVPAGALLTALRRRGSHPAARAR
ncbi:MAG: NAD(P)/FAD-dependent oxidoreductase [Candidatus Rokuibacteriota bacterium]